jgi:hypothetical protein
MDQTAEMHIRELEKLPENWDSYGGLPIQPGIADQARSVLAALSTEPYIYPMPSGGIQLAWHHEAISIEIEPGGKVTATILDTDLE